MNEKKKMTGEGYPPADLEVTKEDLASSGWRRLLPKKQPKLNGRLYAEFRAAEKEAEEAGENGKWRVLYLLGEACSMIMDDPDNLREPFIPCWQLSDGHRSVLPEDLSDTDLAFFADILESIDDVAIEGRIADVLWCRNYKGRGHKYAELAIDAYSRLDLTTEDRILYLEAESCWKRAFGLARGLRKKDAKDKMQAALIESLGKTCNFYYYEISKLVFEFCPKCPEAKAIKQCLMKYADQEGIHPYDKAECLSLLAQWTEEKDKVEAQIGQAEAYVRWAEKEMPSKPPTAWHHYDKAIGIYQRIPKKEREQRGLDERISELEPLRANAFQKGIEHIKITDALTDKDSQAV